MSSEIPPGTPPANPAPQPFTRGRIQWSRPPQPVFRVGPLPGSSQPARTETPRPPRGSGGGILSGSMVPQRPAPLRPVDEPDLSARPLPPAEPEPVATLPDPEPAPVVAAPEPAPDAAPAPEIVVEASEPEPLVTVPPPLSDAVHPSAGPRKLPSVVVTPAIYAGVSAAIEKVTPKDRWVIVAGVAALVVIVGFVWLATLPSGAPAALDPDAPTPLAAGALPDPEADTLLPLEAEAGTVPARSGVAAPRTPAPRTTAPLTPAVRAPGAAPTVAVPVPETSAPQPYIETAPLLVEPPTPAEAPSVDPDAPIATRPQPLD